MKRPRYWILRTPKQERQRYCVGGISFVATTASLGRARRFSTRAEARQCAGSILGRRFVPEAVR